MRKVCIVGVGATRFGSHPETPLKDLAVDACTAALTDAGMGPDQIDAFYLGNYGAGMLVGQAFTASVVANELGLRSIPVTRIEDACASGGVALRHGWLMVASGQADAVLVAGVEKMTSAPTEAVTQALAAATDVESPEAHAGLTFPGFFAMVACRHMHEYGTRPEHLAAVAVKNRRNAQANPRAQFFGKPATLDQVLASRLIADPLRLFDCSPISDGAAAAVLCAADRLPEGARAVDILTIAHALGPANLSDMPDLTSFPATREAARQAYEAAGLGPEDIDVLEVHDCFSIAEVVALEDLGFVPKGEGGPAVAEGLTALDGRFPVNPSGGLLSKGHPIGATGLAQCFEIVRQLRGEADNQVTGARIGLMHNLGGTGGTVTVSLLARRGVA